MRTRKTSFSMIKGGAKLVHQIFGIAFEFVTITADDGVIGLGRECTVIHRLPAGKRSISRTTTLRRARRLHAH